MPRTWLVLPTLLLLCWSSLWETARAEEALWRVQFSLVPEKDAANSESQDSRTIEGRILVEAQDGGLLLEDRAGALWNITPDRLILREMMEGRFSSLSHEELASHLRSELGTPAQVVITEHYVVVTTGSRVYAEWCGETLERLYAAFAEFWRAAGLSISDASSPLPVVIHAQRAAYTRAAQAEGGAFLTGAHGFYSMRTNLVVVVDALVDRGIEGSSAAEVPRILRKHPDAVSTLAHESAHQLGFNCGLHTRYADNPVWLTEGVAMLFEVPDLRSSTGWSTIGRVNRSRLKHFRETFTKSDKGDRLTSLIADDERFRNAETAEAAYAEAWALTSLLLERRPKEFATYLTKCSENTRFVWETPAERVQGFERAFGVAPSSLQAELVRFIRRIR